MACISCHFYLDVLQRSAEPMMSCISMLVARTRAFVVENCVNISFAHENARGTKRKLWLWHKTSFYKVEQAPPIPTYKSASVHWLCSFVFCSRELATCCAPKITTSVVNLRRKFPRFSTSWLRSVMADGDMYIGPTGRTWIHVGWSCKSYRSHQI